MILTMCVAVDGNTPFPAVQGFRDPEDTARPGTDEQGSHVDRDSLSIRRKAALPLQDSVYRQGAQHPGPSEQEAG